MTRRAGELPAVKLASIRAATDPRDHHAAERVEIRALMDLTEQLWRDHIRGVPIDPKSASAVIGYGTTLLILAVPR